MYQLKFNYLSFDETFLIGNLIREKHSNYLKIADIKLHQDNTVTVIINKCDLVFLKQDIDFMADFKLKSNSGTKLISGKLQKILTNQLIGKFLGLKSNLKQTNNIITVNLQIK